MRMIMKLPDKGSEIDIRCHCQGGAFRAMDAEVCMFYNRLFITRVRSWKLAVSGWCCHTYCLDGRNTHKIQALYIYIYHITYINITNIFIYIYET